RVSRPVVHQPELHCVALPTEVLRDRGLLRRPGPRQVVGVVGGPPAGRGDQQLDVGEGHACTRSPAAGATLVASTRPILSVSTAMSPSDMTWVPRRSITTLVPPNAP